MPRARCHWALLIRTRHALQTQAPEAYDLAVRHRAEFFAGGMAPDAIRLFGGRDKLSSHFYDDQRRETWDRVVEAMCLAQPAVADPGRLDDPARAWMLGYLTHVLTDVAYWRHVVTKLPPFPAHMGVHHGAWVLADQIAIPAGERTLDAEDLRFDAAPPWVDEPAMRQMLARVTGRILAMDGIWPVELTYLRSRPDLDGKPEAEVLAALLPEWEANLARARTALPADVWPAFQADAVAGSVAAITTYLGAPVRSTAGLSPA
ncbi:MAG: zinc dependent phospholipase C family protein [Chloroflexota bacterium]